MGNILETCRAQDPHELASPARYDSQNYRPQKRKPRVNHSTNRWSDPQYTKEEITNKFFSQLTRGDTYRMNPDESLSYKRQAIHQSLFLIYREVYFRQDINLIGGYKVPKNVIFSFLVVDSCTKEWMALDTLLRPLYYKVKNPDAPGGFTCIRPDAINRSTRFDDAEIAKFRDYGSGMVNIDLSTWQKYKLDKYRETFEFIIDGMATKKSATTSSVPMTTTPAVCSCASEKSESKVESKFEAITPSSSSSSSLSLI